MGHQRPWKVYFHHDGTKAYGRDESMPESYTIDTSRPIDGKSSHATEGDAEVAARRVSRNGGNARIMLHESMTGIESEIRVYAPYEAAMEDLASTVCRPE